MSEKSPTGQEPKKVVALYARVSTLDQNCEVQLEDLRRYASKRFASHFEYTDAGVSGTQRHRPQLDALMKDARKRSFDVVLVWKFDRFARSLKHLIESLEEFSALGIDFISLTEGIDTTTSVGQLLFHIVRAVARRHGPRKVFGQTHRTPPRLDRCGSGFKTPRRGSLPARDCSDAQLASVACAACLATSPSENRLRHMDKIRTIDHLLTPEEAAEILRVKLSWLYQHTRRKSQDRIPFVKVGRYLRFREQDLVAYIESRKLKS